MSDIDEIRAALAEATSAARTAEASANALSLTINGNELAGADGKPNRGLRGDLAEHTTEIKRLDRGRIVNRVIGVLGVIAAVIGIVVGVLGQNAAHKASRTADTATSALQDQRRYQDCVNRQADARQAASLDFYQHIEDWAQGQLAALNALITDPTKKQQAVTDFLASYRHFIDYAQTRVGDLSKPAKGC